MKLLLGLLVLANLALYLLWGPYRLALPVEPVVQPTRGAPGNLQLLSEVEPGRAPAATAPSQAARPASAVRLAGLPTPDPGATPTPEATAEARIAEPENASPDGGSGTIDKIEASPGPRPVRIAICYTFGTLNDRLLADRVRADLAGIGLAATIRAESRRGELSGYWVLLPARQDLDQAQATVAELQAKGIDSFIVTSGEFRNGISLGFFHGQNSADRLEKQIRGLGFNPRTVIRYRRDNVYWVDLDEDGSKRFEDPAWRKLADSYPMLGRFVRDCG